MCEYFICPGSLCGGTDLKETAKTLRPGRQTVDILFVEKIVVKILTMKIPLFYTFGLFLVAKIQCIVKGDLSLETISSF